MKILALFAFIFTLGILLNSLFVAYPILFGPWLVFCFATGWVWEELTTALGWE